MKLIIEDLAFGFAQTLISTDQRVLLEAAEALNIPAPKAVASAAFPFGEAFLEEYNERYER